jgi:hypothetical protein
VGFQVAGIRGERILVHLGHGYHMREALGGASFSSRGNGSEQG